MSALITYLQAMDEGTVVLAATERVARHLKMQAALLQSVTGKRAWFTKGKISTIAQWVEQVWSDLLPDEQLLLPVQELAVVKSVADRSGLLPDTLISSTKTARRIGQAYNQFLKFQLPADRDRFRFKQEYEVIWAWRELIQAECRLSGTVFRAELPGRVAAAIKAGEVQLPTTVVLVGVQHVTPAERAVFDALAAAGCDLIELAGEDPELPPQLVRTATMAEEVAQAAQWVADLLRPYQETPHAAPSVALLVPNVRDYQGPLVDALTMAVCPGALLPAGVEGEIREAWDISSGATLGSRPVIRAGMDILASLSGHVETETFSRMLRSRWVGDHATEGASRALCDVWLRENSGLQMGPKDYLRAVEASRHPCPLFAERFRKALTRLEAQTQGLYPSEWADVITETLECLGWPEHEQLSSANFQTLEAWEEALKVFRALDYQLGPCSFERAYMWLREIVDTRRFQPRLGHVAPVSIMPYEDAVGLHFDHAWVLGASNKVLPLPADPNPFLPLDLLAEAGVPEATGEGQLERARRLLNALLAASQEVTVSCFSHDANGSNTGPSELLGPWPDVSHAAPALGSLEQEHVGKLDRDLFIEEVAPAVDDEERQSLKGGVSIFSSYAESPFLAFASNRLQATPFPTIQQGLDPRIQGTMLHRCLELFWKKVRTQAALRKFSGAELANEIQDAIEGASTTLLYKLSWRYGSHLIRLEQKRLHSLLTAWLELEKRRELPFRVVKHECRTEVDVFGVPLTVTLDRVDEVLTPDNKIHELLMDYKSGANFVFSNLNAKSLKEPQLPIYATCVEPQTIGLGNIEGVALAQVNNKKMGIHTRSAFTAKLLPDTGFSKDEVSTPSAWTLQVETWRGALAEMAQGILGGNAVLNEPGKGLPMGYQHLTPLLL